MDSNANLSDLLNLSTRTSTFVSVDVVGSTQLKTGQNEQDIIYTFLTYHKLVSDLSYTQHGEVINITGDGMMCRFQRADDAVHMTQELLQQLPTFNKKHNRLTQSIAIRIGVHTGPVYESESMSSGQIISKTIDITAKLQKGATANHALISEATTSALSDKSISLKRVGWDAALGTNVFDYAVGGALAASALKSLPKPARVLVIESELDETAKLKKILGKSQHDTFSVFDQNQASLALQTWSPHMVLLSLDLPWKTGWELLTSLRTDAKYSGTPIIAMSRQATGDTIQKSMQIGANGFLRQPSDAQQVIKRVEMVLREFYL